MDPPESAGGAPPAYIEPGASRGRESWQPVEERPSREHLDAMSEETRRYQLVDRPQSGAHVLHAPGGIRIRKKEQEQKNRDISKEGDLL